MIPNNVKWYPMVPCQPKWYRMVPNCTEWGQLTQKVCGLVKWRLEIKEKSKLRQNLQFCPPLSDFTHLVVPRTCLFCCSNLNQNPIFSVDLETKCRRAPSSHKVCCKLQMFTIFKSVFCLSQQVLQFEFSS